MVLVKMIGTAQEKNTALMAIAKVMIPMVLEVMETVILTTHHRLLVIRKLPKPFLMIFLTR